jgi:hypothetical protein
VITRTNTPESHRKLTSIIFSLLAAGLLVGSLFLARRNPAKGPIILSGFECMLLAGYLRESDASPAHTKLTVGVSALISASTCYGLWKTLGAMAIAPSLVLLLLAGIVILYARRHQAPRANAIRLPTTPHNDDASASDSRYPH